MLTFNADLHEYRWRGKVVPSVTQVLDGLHSFAGVPWEVLEAARARGTAVHTACQFFDEDDLDEDRLAVDDWDIWCYLQGWKAFVRDTEPNWSVIESPFYCPALGFAGTPDRIGEFTFRGQRMTGATLDIKSSASSHPTWGVQTAAYAHLAKTGGGPRFTVQLEPHPDGRYRLLEWKDPHDWPVFVSLMTLHNWRAKHERAFTTTQGA